MIEIQNLTYRIGARVLFDQASLVIPEGKIGLVGPNGCGKTTLFRLILKMLEPDVGNILYKSGARWVHVQQEIKEVQTRLLDFVLSADYELMHLKNKIESGLDENVDMSEIYALYNAKGGPTAVARAASILSGLGFSQKDFERPLSEFSGGWRIRASLAAALFAPSEYLLLDEPTNHLDLKTSIWLENYIVGLRKTVLIISHEKHFLNMVCDHIVSIYHGKLHLFKGNYDTYVSTRDIQEKALLKTIENQEKLRDHLQSFVDRFGAKATKAKQAQCRVKMLERMEIPTFVKEDYHVQFDFPQPFPEVDKRLICCKDVSVGYDNGCVVKHVTLNVDKGDRIALLGINGSGKSTLAKLFAGRLIPKEGSLMYAKNCKIAYFSQQQTDELDPQKTAIEMVLQRKSDWTETQVRSFLARFGIIQARSQSKIEQLSGGEKSRVLFALNSLETPHLMIFDEPTNHLDMEAREALIEGLRAYTGSVVLITHDFFTLSQVCDQFWVVEEGTCKVFQGSIEDYKNSLMIKKCPSQDVLEKNTAKKFKGSELKLLQKKQKHLGKIERAIAELEQKKQILEAELSQSYTLETYKQFEACCQQLQALENEWLESADAV